MNITIGSIRERSVCTYARKQREDFEMMLLRRSREQKVSVLLDRLGNPLGRVHAGQPTNLREDDGERETGNVKRRTGRGEVGEVGCKLPQAYGVDSSVSLYC